MAVDPLKLTQFADQPHYRALSGTAYQKVHPPIPSLEYKTRLALQYATRKGAAFEKFDEAKAVGAFEDTEDPGTGFGVAHARAHPSSTLPAGQPPIDDEDFLATLEAHAGGYAIGDEHLVAGSGAFVGRPRAHRVKRRALPVAARPRVGAADSDSDDEPDMPPDETVESKQHHPSGGAGAADAVLGETTAQAIRRTGVIGAVSDDSQVLRATRQHLPVQARMAGLELVPGEGGRAATIVQKTPGLMTPAERREMLAVEVAHSKAEKLRKSLVSQRARRAMLMARRHPAGALGVGGIEAGSATARPGEEGSAAAHRAPPGTGAYDKRRVVMQSRRQGAAQRTAARRAALMRVGNSVARRGYDLVAPDRPLGSHPEAAELRQSLRDGGLGDGPSGDEGGSGGGGGSSTRANGSASIALTLRRTAERGAEATAQAKAAARETESLTGGASRLSRVNKPVAADGLACMTETGDYRGDVVGEAAGVSRRGAARDTDGGLQLTQRLGRSMPEWMQRETSAQRLFPKPEASPGRWAIRAQAIVDKATRGRGYDIVTGRSLPPGLKPSTEATAQARPSIGELRQSHPSMATAKSFVDR